MEDSFQPFGRDLNADWYFGDLLTLAHDLADRLLLAFNTKNGIPHPRVNLLHGVPVDGIQETCTAGVGSLILEFGELILLGNMDWPYLMSCHCSSIFRYDKSPFGRPNLRVVCSQGHKSPLGQ